MTDAADLRPAMPPLPGDLITKEEEKRLAEPFDPDLIKFKPQSYNPSTKKHQALAHADPRAYEERLNEVFGLSGWRQIIQKCFTVPPMVYPGLLQLMTGEVKPNLEGDGYKLKKIVDKAYFGGAIVVIVALEVRGHVIAENAREGRLDEQNFMTAPYSAAFKRACVKIGLGKYLYDLGYSEHAYDRGSNRWKESIWLPDWAVPKTTCGGCKKETIESFESKTRGYYSCHRLITEGRQYSGKALCKKCIAPYFTSTANRAQPQYTDHERTS